MKLFETLEKGTFKARPNRFTVECIGEGTGGGMTICKVPDMGWFSVITDPTGATFGLWQPKARK
ncbi:MAG: hypothetical protein AB1390_00525 [Nitrospirota bacterium]